MKKFVCAFLVAAAVLAGSITSFAGVWKAGAGENQNRWWYDNEDGTYAAGGWQWIDGNGDGTAECYYFDQDGWMASDTVTPDGYTVNADGAWVQDGQAVTRQVNIPITVQVGESRFSAYLYDNEASRQLASMFPLTLHMSELNGNEKYYYLPDSLPTQTQIIGAIHTGDLMLYGSDCLVLFYKDFNTSYRYTRLGCVENPQGLAQVLGSGDAVVTFRQE